MYILIKQLLLFKRWANNLKPEMLHVHLGKKQFKEAPYSSMRDVCGTSTWTIPRQRTIKTMTKIDRAFFLKKVFLKGF
jgi:hypothetical protein